jgi:hypothetical protein
VIATTSNGIRAAVRWHVSGRAVRSARSAPGASSPKDTPPSDCWPPSAQMKRFSPSSSLALDSRIVAHVSGRRARLRVRGTRSGNSTHCPCQGSRNAPT